MASPPPKAGAGGAGSSLIAFAASKMMKKWQLTEFEEVDNITKHFRVRYEPNPDYVDLVRARCVVCLHLLVLCKSLVHV